MFVLNESLVVFAVIGAVVDRLLGIIYTDSSNLS